MKALPIFIALFPIFIVMAHGAGVTHDFVEVRRTTGLPFIDFSNDGTSDFDIRLGCYGDDWLALMGGKLGINTTSPDHELDVKGKIRAEEIIVETGWSDYVFEPDYPLLSLEEVDAFILRHGHLPGIPAGAEVESEGLKLGEMQALMMAKIEELTLHLIEQEKRMDALEAENAELKSQLLK